MSEGQGSTQVLAYSLMHVEQIWDSPWQDAQGETAASHTNVSLLGHWPNGQQAYFEGRETPAQIVQYSVPESMKHSGQTGQSG